MWLAGQLAWKEAASRKEPGPHHSRQSMFAELSLQLCWPPSMGRGGDATGWGRHRSLGGTDYLSVSRVISCASSTDANAGALDELISQC